MDFLCNEYKVNHIAQYVMFIVVSDPDTSKLLYLLPLKHDV